MTPILFSAFLLAAAPGTDCGVDLPPAIAAAWRSQGGAEGPLGCPTTGAAATAPSPQGSRGLAAAFGAAGGIYAHASGPRAGQTYAVTGCAYTLYFQYGGPAGWLGLPISDQANTADGQTQRFEGGTITWQRAGRQCSAEPAERTTAAGELAAPAQADLAPLDLFFDPARDDYLSAASQRTVASAVAAHYDRQRTEALVPTAAFPGSVPLKLYWNEAQGAHVTVATHEGERDALDSGAVYDGLQGYVRRDPAPGAKALRQYVSPHGRHLLVATPEGEAQAQAHGYVFQRIEGYASAAP